MSYWYSSSGFEFLMAYSEATVLAGGLVHIPILIGLVGFFERFRNAISKKSGKSTQSVNKTAQAPKPPENHSPAPKAAKTSLLVLSPASRATREAGPSDPTIKRDLISILPFLLWTVAVIPSSDFLWPKYL